MGFYAPGEFHLPSQTNITIEPPVQFFPQNATFFNVTVLNPSYSTSNATIQHIKVETPDGKLHNTETPLLPFSLQRGASKTFQSFWNWGNYTSLAARIHVYTSDGTESGLETRLPFMNFTVIDANLDPSRSVKNFNITVQNIGSSTSVSIIKILVNGTQVSTNPMVPYILTNATDATPATFVVNQDWEPLARTRSNVTITLQTLQGYTPYLTVRTPYVPDLSVQSVDFNPTIGTNHFNVTVFNAGVLSPIDLNISEVTVSVAGSVTSIQNGTWTAYTLPPPLELTTKLKQNKSTLIVCPLDWSTYRDQVATITVVTVQGFEVSYEKLIP
jgi:archaellum component FlaF (FlaF/FlaG flagellin family)